MRPRSLLVGVLALASITSVGQSQMSPPRESSPRNAEVSEELVHVRTADSLTEGGAIFTPANRSAKPVAIIWVHGQTANFYEPTYVNIARNLAARGYVTITGNTRTHDLGTVAGYRGSQRIRGGAYWGVPTQQVLDIAAWIDFAEQRGFRKVVLVGHSAGAPAVQVYQAEKQDPRVAGLVIASGRVQPGTAVPDSGMMAEATRLVAADSGEKLLNYPNRPISFISAATFLELARNWPKDFFGVKSADAPITRVRCPILAWFASKEPDVGTFADLQLLVATLKRLPSGTGPARVDVDTIQNADHMYDGEEEQVARKLAAWIDKVSR